MYLCITEHYQKHTMSNITFSLNLPPWLAQWYTNRCGGGSPLRLPKGSVESTIVQRFSRRKSETDRPDFPAAGALTVEIPENKAKPAEIYSYLPDSAKVMLEKSIRSQFDLCLFEDLIRPLFPGMLKRDLIYSWMEKNCIEIDETNWFAVEKRYSRLRRRMLSDIRVKKTRKKTSE